MEQLGDAATLVVLVFAVFAGVAIPRAFALDRRDAAREQAENETVHEGDTNE